MKQYTFGDSNKSNLITVDHLQSGMTTFEPVFDQRHRLLIQEGTVLTSWHIRQIRSRGVSHVIVNHSIAMPIARSQSEDTRDYAEIFLASQGDPFMDALVNAARQKFALRQTATQVGALREKE